MFAGEALLFIKDDPQSARDLPYASIMSGARAESSGRRLYA